MTDVVDLHRTGADLIETARAQGRAQAIRAVVTQPGQRLLLLGFPAGGGLPDHDAPGPASLQCLSGEVVLRSGTDSWTVPAGSAVQIPQARHEVSAAEDSLCLLALSVP